MMVESKIYVGNLTCRNCTKILRNAFLSVEGIINVKIKLPKKEIMIRFDPEQVSLNQIINIINEKKYIAVVQQVKSESQAY